MVGKNLIGQRFGRLIVIKQIGIDKRTRQKKWLCKCDCGNMKETITSYLTSGDTSSCGCYRRECETENLKKGRMQIKHGKYDTRLYQTWADMKSRCLNKKNKAFKDYGGRGIKICGKWLEFIPFYNWAINNGYKDNLTIDRIDVNGNYEPSNCRWVTWKVQANNKRKTKKIIIFGEIGTAYYFEKKYKIKAHTLIDRYKKGYRNEEVIYKGNLRYSPYCRKRGVENEILAIKRAV